MEKNVESVLNMVDLYFSSISFIQKKDKTGEIKLNINYKIEHQKNLDDNSLFRVIITTNICDNDDKLKLEVEATGIFKICDLGIDEETKNSLINLNTVAIMFPYIRSQISIITSQPGLMPVQIPIVDVNKLVNISNQQ